MISIAYRPNRSALEFELLSGVWRPLERRSNQCDRAGQIAKHQFCFDANDAIAKARKLAITACIRCAATRVIAAIHFNDELDAWGTEISDEAVTDRHLPAKAHAQLTSIERRPQPSFRLGETIAMLSSEELEPSRGFRVG